MKSSLIVAPSVLASDLSNLTLEAVRAIDGGADWLHLDIMDGHFVKNLTFGPPVVSSLSKSLAKLNKKIFFDCHLMVMEPEKWLDALRHHTDSITFHLETVKDPTGLIKLIKDKNLKVGISIKPETKAQVLEPFLELVDMILIMTVEPGFGGQKFIRTCMSKVEFLKNLREEKKLNFLIQVDGGIGLEEIRIVSKVGADVVVAGSSIYSSKNIKETIQKFKDEYEKNK